MSINSFNFKTFCIEYNQSWAGTYVQIYLDIYIK